MSQTVLEVLLGILLAFFVGCILGYLLRWIFRRSSSVVIEENHQPATLPATEPVEVEDRHPTKPADTVPPKAAAKSPVRHSEPAVTGYETVAGEQAVPAATEHKPGKAASKPSQPKGIASPRGGTPDDLQQISGVGPKIETTLHRLGIFHFDQVAEWTMEEAQWVDDHLKFKGRIARDEWIKQARQLASGRTNERVRRPGTDVGKKSPKPKSPSGTRRR
jgi:predicted flap endonuclease-1-like 5' DNA nuclease